MLKNKIILTDFILLFGMVLAPMTALRIWKVGPAELLFLAWSLIHFKNIVKLRLSNILVSFWFFFFIVSGVGSLFGVYFYPDESDLLGMLPYVFFFIISSSIYYYFIEKDKEYIYSFLSTFSILSVFFYFFLFLYGTVISQTILGIPLFYRGIRFSPLGLNPHQFGCLIAVVCPIFYSTSKQHIVLKLSIVALCIFLGLQTKSSTLILAWIFSLGLYLLIESILKGKKILPILFIGTVLLTMIFIFYISIGHQLLLDFIHADPNGEGRLSIFSSIYYIFYKNPFFGLGPGIHAFNGLMEFHNTYIEIFAMSGLIGLCGYLYFIQKIFFTTILSNKFVYTLLPLHLYGVGGFAMRRLIFWAIVAFIVVLIDKTIKEDKKISDTPAHELSL